MDRRCWRGGCINRHLDVSDPGQLRPVTSGFGPVQIKTGLKPVAVSPVTVGNQSMPVLVRLPKIAGKKRPVRVRLHQK